MSATSVPMAAGLYKNRNLMNIDGFEIPFSRTPGPPPGVRYVRPAAYVFNRCKSEIHLMVGRILKEVSCARKETSCNCAEFPL